MNYEKTLELIKEVPFFSGLSHEERKFLSSLDCNFLRFGPSEKILREGETDTALFILLGGEVLVTKNKPPEVTLTQLKPGAVFGEISLVGKRPRTTSIAASSNEVSVLKIDGQLIQQLNPILLNKVKDRLIGLLVQRLDAMNNSMIDMIR